MDGDVRDHEVNETVAEQHGHQLRAMPVRHSEFDCRQNQDDEVEAHGVDEGRREDCVVRFRDRASHTRDPLGRQENAYVEG